jgi:hypothetical protein
MRVTLAAIGRTGVGKSEFLNGYVQKPGAFKACADPKSVTKLTSSTENNLAACLRTAIDTQGLDDSEGIDAAHIQQMVAFLTAWPHGVNAFALVINGQDDRFDAGTQKIVKLLDTFFNNPTFWDHVCIVFTKWYAYCDHLDKTAKEQQYRQLVLDLVAKCPGQENRQPPPLPVFFVDSRKFETDQETKNQYALLHGFVCGLPPLPTQKVVAAHPTYRKVEKETRTRIVDVRISGNTRIQTHAYEEQDKLTGYDGKVTFSGWTAIRTWETQQTRSARTEKKTECESENREQLWRTEKGGRIGLWGPHRYTQVPDGFRVTKQMVEKERTIQTDFDGRDSWGDWRIIRRWAA